MEPRLKILMVMKGMTMMKVRPTPLLGKLTKAICPLDYHEAGLIIDDDSKSTYLDEPADY